MPNAGQLRKRVTFKRPAVGRDDYGAQTSGHTTLFTVWGGLQETRGRERVLAGALAAPMTGELTVRSSSDTQTVTEADFVTIDGVDWNVRGIRNPDQRGKWLVMDVERKVAV